MRGSLARVSPTPAAVLVPVFRDDDGELRIVLVVRGSFGAHGDQVGLPGGKPEPGDASLLETALREAEEEIGLARADVDVVAELDVLDSRTTGFRVSPFLARVRGERRWRLAHGEIAAVVTPLARELADPAARREQPVVTPRWPEPRIVDCIPLGDGHVLWGLTLRLLEGVVPRLVAGEWDV